MTGETPIASGPGRPPGRRGQWPLAAKWLILAAIVALIALGFAWFA